MRLTYQRFGILLAAMLLCSVWLASAAHVEAVSSSRKHKVKHVLLVSLDGFHDFDLSNYVRTHPSSALATLVARGINYTKATTASPSDSFPGTLAMVTGGSPVSTGVYYDVSWDDNLSPAGSDCLTRGAVIPYNEAINFSTTTRFTSINPAKLPRDPDHGCIPVYPHQYLRVNTIYEVIKAAGLRTAAADKHPSYEILNGPSGTGVDDLFTPEINPDKKDIAKTMQNDELKVQAVLNQIAGYTSTDAGHANFVGVPAILGMDFQAPNIGKKFSGYTDAAGTTPAIITTLGSNAGNAPGLAQAFDYVDGALGRMLAALDEQDLSDSTLIIITSKHGNSPVDRTQLSLINPATTLVTMINSVQAGLAAQVTDDTNALIWLKDHSRAAEVAAVLQANAASIGAESIYVGAQVDELFDGQLAGNPSRRPDIIVEPTLGVVYAAPASKLSDHGGFHEQDLHVPLVVVYPGQNAGTVDQPVSLRQIAPTILHALGLHKRDLDAVRLEKTRTLPGLGNDEDGDDQGPR
jgi:hypothetical protein